MVTTADNSLQKYDLLIQIQGGRLLGLPGGGAGAFPLPDQVVQRGHRSDGETFQNKADAKSSRDLFQFPCPDGSTGAACPRNEQDANVLYDNKMLGVPRCGLK